MTDTNISERIADLRMELATGLNMFSQQWLTDEEHEEREAELTSLLWDQGVPELLALIDLCLLTGDYAAHVGSR